MNIDPKIKDSIEEAVQNFNQDKALSTKLLAWFEELAKGNEELQDKESVLRHIELLYDNCVVDIGEGKE